MLKSVQNYYESFAKDASKVIFEDGKRLKNTWSLVSKRPVTTVVAAVISPIDAITGFNLTTAASLAAVGYGVKMEKDKLDVEDAKQRNDKYKPKPRFGGKS